LRFVLEERSDDMEQRVVVTGMGLLTPVGTTVESTWEALQAGRSGIGPITAFDASAFATRIAGEVRDFDPYRWIERKEAKRMDRFTQLGVAAAMMAVEDARLPIHEGTRERIGVLIGSGIGGISTWEEQHRILLERGPDRVSPFLIPMMICDMASGQTSILLGLAGPNSCVVTACATGTNAIGDAAAIIRRGDADAMLAGGAEAGVSPIGIGGFCAMRAMSTRNDEPERASRPFDAERDGFVMGEGAGVVVLESLEFAQARGARILAEVAGYGMSADAHHMTAPVPGGLGAVRAMRAALRSGGLEPADVDYINAHGTSTDANDKNETLAVKQVMGEHAHSVPISSTKSMMGHLLGAAGAVEAIFCALTIRDGILPPTINYEHPDPDCDLDYVPNEARRQPVRVAMSNSFGFGGHNATLILKRFEA
jgi:3-oxoacyl-[acyl-carrier-protein] synthase II